MNSPFSDLTDNQRLSILDILLFVMHSDGAEQSEAQYVVNYQLLAQISPETVGLRSDRVRHFFERNPNFLDTNQLEDETEFVELFVAPLLELSKAKVWSLFSVLIKMVWADGQISDTERALLGIIGHAFGIDSNELDSILSEHGPV